MAEPQFSGRTPRGGRKARQYGVDRSCTVPECTVRLSRYNKHEVCATHLPTFSRPRGRLSFDDLVVEHP